MKAREHSVSNHNPTEGQTLCSPRWVPLKVINWGFGFTSTVTAGFGNEEQGFTSSYPQTPRQLTGTETALHPEWSHIVSFRVVQKNEP